MKNLGFSRILGFYFLFLVPVNAPFAAHAGCDENLSMVARPGIKSFLRPWFETLLGDFLRSLADSPYFIEFLKERYAYKGFYIDARSITSTQVNEYIDWYLRRLSGRALIKSQAQCLRQILSDHGFSEVDALGSPSVRDARESLVRLSSVNSNRMLSDLPSPQSSAPDAQSLALASQLDFTFIHMTQWIERGRMPMPLISSKELMKWVGQQGRNTRAFHRYILRTDNVVHAFPRPVLAGRLLPSVNDQLPYRRIQINYIYARNNGLISSYIMLPQHLQRFGEVFAPAETKRLQHLWETDIFEDEEELAFTVTDFRAISSKMHLLDFTLEDFIALTRSRFAWALTKLAKRDPQKHAEILALVASNKLDVLEFWKMTFPPTDIPLGDPEIGFPFVMTIPVAVPVGQLRQLRAWPSLR